MSGNDDGRRKERGFTLLEILIAMVVLAVGGVSILSLFTAAVKLQYDSVINERTAAVLAEVLPKVQEYLDDHEPTKEMPVPVNRDPEHEKPFEVFDAWVRERCPKNFSVHLEYSSPAAFPAGEGALAEIIIFFRGEEVARVEHILQRTTISEKEIRTLKSYKEEQAAKKKREGED